jgi:hypothetical protein
MIDIPTESIQVIRADGGGWSDATGRYERGQERRLPAEAMSIQPLTADEIKLLPEGRRTAETLKVYLETKVRCADEKAGTAADRIEHAGKVYEVIAVEDWSRTDIPHFKAILAKIDGEGGGLEPAE